MVTSKRMSTVVTEKAKKLTGTTESDKTQISTIFFKKHFKKFKQTMSFHHITKTD